MFARVRLAGTALLFCSVVALAHPARAESADRAGWSVSVDPRKRAFLHYVPENGGDRVLTIGCLRDVDSFTVMSEGLTLGIDPKKKATLMLANGAARYAIDGEVEAGAMRGTPTFSAETDADRAALRQIGLSLLPVLEGKGQLTLSVGSAQLTLPTSGLTAPLSRLKTVCFGSR